MKLMLSALAFLFALPAVAPKVTPAQQGASAPATYIGVADVQAKLNPSPEAGVNPQPNIRVVDAGGYNVAVGALHRSQTPPSVAAVHFQVTEIYHVIDGTATLVTGGTMVNAKTRPSDSIAVKLEDGPGASGTAIQGGVSQRIKAGDVVVIPAGVPHWFSAIDGSISYLVVRVDASRVLAVK